MPLFRRKKDVQQAPQGAPAIPGLDLPDNHSILSLAGTHNYGLTDMRPRSPTAELQSGTATGTGTGISIAKGSQSLARQTSSKGSKMQRAASQDALVKTNDAAISRDRKYGTMNNISAVAQDIKSGNQDGNDAIKYKEETSTAQKGHKSTPSSLSRSMSQGAVPYHLPWTRQLPSHESSEDKFVRAATRKATSSEESKPSSSSAATSAAPAATPATPAVRPGESTPQSSPSRGAKQHRERTAPPISSSPPSAFYNTSSSLPGLYQQPLDFRTSPSSVQQPSPAQRRRLMDTARHMSLKRSKAPLELNVMMAGAINTGKTSFARALLATCDLSLCSDEAKIAAAMFGIAADPKHPTRDTDPITPLRTAQYDILSGIDLHPSSLLPLAMIESGAASNAIQSKVRPQSVFSTATAGGGSGGRVRLSICDTPGIDFELEDEFEIERKTVVLLRHVEERLQKSLMEESKVKRQQRGDAHIHLVMYFIDPRFMLDRISERKTRREQAIQAAYARANAAQAANEQQRKQKEQQKAKVNGDISQRMRSTSMTQHSASAAAAAAAAATATASANGHSNGMSKQAQTAQLRQSMEAVQARAANASSKRADPSATAIASSVPAEFRTTHTSKDSISLVNGISESTSDEASQAELDEVGPEGLSRSQISILARLSERANVLPIIAKADTLTQQELDDVREAVRTSIVRANLDLGTFGLEGLRKQKKASEQRRARAPSQGVNDEETSSSPVLDSSYDTPLSTSPVKVIRIRSRRSYSATGGERMTASASGHSLLGHGGGADVGTDDGHSNLGHTNPLFDGGADEDEMAEATAEEELAMSEETLAKHIPFAVFVPDPIRVRERQTRPTDGIPVRKGSMNSIAENLPPVPPLPREIADLKKHKPKSGSMTTTNSSDAGLSTIEQEETQEVMRANESMSDEHRDSDLRAERQTIPDCAAPASDPTSTSGAAGTRKLANAVSIASLPPPPPPPASRRFQRSFRFGNANVLDARQCDFALLRTCVLGTHVDSLRNITTERYERFRSQRLELRQLARQSSSVPSPTPMPTLYTATSSQT